MGSTHKTQRLALNQWIGEDRPKRLDFNEDNAKIDAAIRALENRPSQEDAYDVAYDGTAMPDVDNAGDALDALQEGKLDRDSTAGGVRVMHPVARYFSDSNAITGALKITFPVGFTGIMYGLKLSGNAASAVWNILLSGFAAAGAQAWQAVSCGASGVVPHDKVQFGIDGGGKACIVIGEVSSVWNLPSLTLGVVTATYTDTLAQLDGWSIELVADLSGITFSGGTLYANTPAPILAKPTWYDMTLINNAGGSIRYNKVGGIVTIDGNLTPGSDNTVIVGALPPGYRPNRYFSEALFHTGMTLAGGRIMAVSTNGDLQFFGPAAGTATAIYRFRLTYMADV